MTKLRLATGTGLLTLLAASCGGGSGPNRPAPAIIEGGGIANGGIAGLLNVYVIDDETKTPVASASVRVGASADPQACTGTTDSTGLVVFDERKGCTILSGKQQVTAWDDDHVPATWIGVDGANLTMGIKPKMPPAIPMATVSGTIDGWDSFPAPAANHTHLGLVMVSNSPDVGDAANNITQDQRPLIGLGVNVCYRTGLLDNCDWTLKTRTGHAAIYALILDLDNKGNTDSADDTVTALGFAVKTGYLLSDKQVLTGEHLALVPDADTVAMTVNFTPPSALDYTTAIPQLDLGTDGRISILLPGGMNGNPLSLKVPKATGPLSGARFDVVTGAQASATDDHPAAMTWIHSVDPTQAVAATSWLPAPTGLAVQNGTYSFTPVTGTQATGIELRVAKGQPSWNVTVFDGSSSFTLPGISPDPLPAGTLEMAVNAIEAPGMDVRNVKFRDLAAKLARMSSDQITFTH